MTYTPTFLRAVEFTLSHEGQYVNDPDDPGGETNWGISKRSYPQLDIKNLTRDGAIAIYHRDFWTPLRCDEMGAVIGGKVFDMAVNIGRGRAVRLLQMSVNTHGGMKLDADGLIGNKTIQAVRLTIPDMMIRLLAIAHAAYYEGLIAARPKNEKYRNGWMKRAGVL